jgi:uncharacterized protein YlzI (FlbEa/FlbD family)
MKFERTNNPQANHKEKQETSRELPPEKQIEAVVDAIDKIELQNSFRSDPQQLKLLEGEKILVRKKISDIWKSVDDYMRMISLVENVKIERDPYSQNRYLERLTEADEMRKMKHNALIADLTSTIRFINNTFGNISEEALEKWEDDLEEKGLPILKAHRIDFPKNILCPDKMDLSDRSQITTWAAALYRSTGKLKRGPHS